MPHFDPFDYALHENPYPVYAQLRAEAPCYHNPEHDFWALSRHADVLAAMKDSQLLSNREGISLESGDLGIEAEKVFSILGMDPPRHGKMRGLVSKAFTPRRVADLAEGIRALARKYLARVAGKGKCDFVEDFAGKLPMDVVSEMFAVPQADREELSRWANLVVHREPGIRGVPPAGIQASTKLLHYFGEMVGERRAKPGDDLAGALIAAEIDGEKLNDGEIVAFCYLMIIAGNETTTKLLANCLYWLQQNPAQREKVRGGAARIPQWIEETLRYDNSTQMIARTSNREFTLHNVTVPAGKKVLLLIGAANRDEAVFKEAARYNIERDAREHLSFGRGAHFCLGAALARLQTRIALEEVQARLPNWRVHPEGAERMHSPNVRGFSKLPITFTPTRGA